MTRFCLYEKNGAPTKYLGSVWADSREEFNDRITLTMNGELVAIIHKDRLDVLSEAEEEALKCSA